jgi:pimeloyl-ACP methyl ester carboxylesterase
VRFVLVHGAWLGGWTWDRLCAELEPRGHEVFAPDLPCDTVGLTQDDYAALIGPQPDAVVVGHSLGGLTASLVEAPLRVFVSPILPLDGAYERFLRPGFGGVFRDDQGRSYWPDLETAAVRLLPDCDRATAGWAFERLRPQAPLDTHGGDLRPHDVVIACMRDVAVDAASFAGLPLVVVELDAGHFPMLTHPGELAETLEELALVGPAGEADERPRCDP